ncbi:ABC transporter permease [Micromonospora sp. WMMD1219]|uniref:ABC transporter permease n=1 Tax=Micromonospora sp. WMMD1219 TaxID=3404115 RepID=UPI003BF5E8C8
MTTLRGALTDSAILTWRNAIRIRRVPDLLVFTTIQPVLFVVLFAYVFGDAITVPGSDYRAYLMPGVIVQSAVWVSAITAIGLADDVRRGIVDRFRSLPMAGAAVLVGRTAGDLLSMVLVVLVCAGAGLAVGWRPAGDAAGLLTGGALVLGFGYALTWVTATLGLAVCNAEVAQSASLIWLFPATFLSSAFVPIDQLPSGLRGIATWNPVSAVTQAVREAAGGAGTAPPNGFAAEHPVWMSIGWIIGILLMFAPLATWRYRRYTAAPR